MRKRRKKRRIYINTDMSTDMGDMYSTVPNIAIVPVEFDD